MNANPSVSIAGLDLASANSSGKRAPGGNASARSAPKRCRPGTVGNADRGALGPTRVSQGGAGVSDGVEGVCLGGRVHGQFRAARAQTRHAVKLHEGRRETHPALSSLVIRD
jgi:hypothetical protein